jgi:hypothetical protein
MNGGRRSAGGVAVSRCFGVMETISHFHTSTTLNLHKTLTKKSSRIIVLLNNKV